MTRSILAWTFLLSTLTPMARADEAPEARYELGADSQRQEGVPRGTITTHVWKDSKIFPGTIRRYRPSRISSNPSAGSDT